MDTLFSLDADPGTHADPEPRADRAPRAGREPHAAPEPRPAAAAAVSPAAAARRQRRSSKGIAPGDVVEVDRRGRRFFALVTSIHQRPSGHHDLDLRPLDPRTTYFTATIREVVAVWRRAA